MVEISIFGWFVTTLASSLSLFLLVAALGSAAFVGFTLLSALRSPRDRRLFLGAAAGLWGVGFLAALVGVRAGGFLGTVAVGASLSGAAAALMSCLGVIARRGFSALSMARARRGASLKAVEAARAKALQEGRRLFLEGGDLKAEVADAEASVEQLRGALSKLEDVRRDLSAKLDTESASVSESAPAPSAPIRADYARLRDEVAVKIDLGRRILTAAEAAAFRLACFEPLRRLLRRRPQEAISGLSRAATASELDDRIELCSEEIKLFLLDVSNARSSLDALEARRPSISMPPSPDENAGAADPLARARREVDAVESAYRAVLERTEVIRLRLATRLGMEEVASAAGALSESAKTMGLDESELQKLLQEVARAESAMSISAPDGSDVRALTDALERTADALDRNDTASLDELLRAMREMD